jgi:hypothetical protein
MANKKDIVQLMKDDVVDVDIVVCVELLQKLLLGPGLHNLFHIKVIPRKEVISRKPIKKLLHCLSGSDCAELIRYFPNNLFFLL